MSKGIQHCYAEPSWHFRPPLATIRDVHESLLKLGSVKVAAHLRKNRLDSATDAIIQ
jgi:hypothetical protein